MLMNRSYKIVQSIVNAQETHLVLHNLLVRNQEKRISTGSRIGELDAVGAVGVLARTIAVSKNTRHR